MSENNDRERRTGAVPTGHFDADGEEIWALNPSSIPLVFNNASNNLCMPQAHLDHELIRGKYFYTLPREVLDEVVSHLGEEAFDAQLLEMEWELGGICGDHAMTVGFHLGQVLPFKGLRLAETLQFSEEQTQRVGLTAAQVNNAVSSYERDYQPAMNRFGRGYSGWLLTNAEFLDDHDRLLYRHKKFIDLWGTSCTTLELPDAYRQEMVAGMDYQSSPEWPAFREELIPFLKRWRLSSLAGPYLPVPLGPLMAGGLPTTVLSQLAEASGIFFLPDTMPIPSREQLRSMVDDALHRGSSHEHLGEWMEIIRRDNSARNQMDPFVRYFELQHYWRILHQRHPNAIYRKAGKLREAFGNVFGITNERIKEDLKVFRRRLGKDWLQRNWEQSEVA
jgi:hypothetical protein